MRKKFRDIFLNIPVEAQGKARARVFKKSSGSYGAATPRKIKRLEKTIGLFAKLEMAKTKQEISTEPLEMKIVAWFHPPKSWSKKKKDEAFDLNVVPAVKPDIDNIAKLILDSMNGIVYVDDTQIVKLTIEKHYEFDERGSTRIEVRTIR